MEIIIVPLLHVILIGIELYTWILVIGVVLSWLVAFNIINSSNRFIYIVGDFCHRATEPLLAPIRQKLPNLGGLDISPLILILALIFIKGVLIEVGRDLS